MQNKREKRGISLIVLVITIIVMIILAAAIIISLNNTGIIGSANKAVSETNEKTVVELANLAWGEAYASGIRDESELKSAVEKALTDNDLKKEDYGMVVTTKGVDIAKGWLQTDSRTVVKGNTTLKIGQDISYDETDGGKITGLTDVDWKVLGAKNGELLIMSTKDVAVKRFNEENTFEGAKKAYENKAKELNEICVPYGKGKNATGARSITVDDIDSVTGYDKTTFNKGLINEYGNVVTYTYNGTTKPAYTGTNGESGTLIEHSNGFCWYDEENVFHYVTAADLTNTENTGKEIAKLRSTYYNYDVDQKTDLKTKSPDAYNMLFGSSDENIYWLASSYVRTNMDYAYFGPHCVGRGGVRGNDFLHSCGGVYNGRTGVRAVVSLSSEFNL